jgi:hypothetical protein
MVRHRERADDSLAQACRSETGLRSYQAKTLLMKG